MPWCCCCPAGLIGGAAGDLLSALVVAGAFAAFLSTTSGLVVSLAGVISQDVFGGSVRGFRLAALISALVPLGIALDDRVAGAGRQRGARVCLYRVHRSARSCCWASGGGG